MLSKKHSEHILIYGKGLEKRLTGLHETCDINIFKFGKADRRASVKIPLSVSQKGFGYFEDRRPGANTDPYLVSTRICATLMELEDEVISEFLKNNVADARELGY